MTWDALSAEIALEFGELCPDAWESSATRVWSKYAELTERFLRIKAEGGPRWQQHLVRRRELGRKRYQRDKAEGGERYERRLSYSRKYHARIRAERGEKYERILDQARMRKRRFRSLRKQPCRLVESAAKEKCRA